jgi:hypothetical protein
MMKMSADVFSATRERLTDCTPSYTMDQEDEFKSMKQHKSMIAIWSAAAD